MFLWRRCTGKSRHKSYKTADECYKKTEDPPVSDIQPMPSASARREDRQVQAAAPEIPIGQLKVIINERNKEIADLKESYEKENNNSARIQIQNDNLKKRLSELERNSSEVNRLNNKLRLREQTTDADTLGNSKVAKLEQERHDLEVSVADLKRENDKLKNNITQLTTRLKQRSEKELTESEKVQSELTVRVADLEQQNAEMKDNITQQTTQLESIRKSSVSSDDYKVLQSKLHNTETELGEAKRELVAMRTRADVLANSKMAKLEQEKRDLEVCVADLKRKHDDHNDTQSKLQRTEKKLRQTEQEKREIEQQNINMKDSINQLTTQVERSVSPDDYDILQSKLRQTEIDLREVERELDDTKTRADALGNSKMAKLEQEKRVLEVCVADLKRKHDDYNDTQSKLQCTEKELRQTKQEKREIEQQNINMKDSINQLTTQVERSVSPDDYDILQSKLRQTEIDVREVERELDDTKTRLSKSMGDKLTNNNPNIVDLSDKNRPSKLGERYKELYDNQWTDAYEILEESEEEEEHIIHILLDVFMDTKRFCEDKTRTQMEATLKAVTHSDAVHESDVPVSVLKYIKDCTKASSARDIEKNFEEYKIYLQDGSFDFAKQALSIPDYLNECFEICWLMSIQDPPVVMSPLLKHGAIFQSSLYSAYTVSGNLIDFIVWPALLLHENGPTLTKGVAQGMKRK